MDNKSMRDAFTISGAAFEPAYMALHRSGELRHRARIALESLRCCQVCPRDCGINRLANETAACRTGRYVIVGSYFPHFGEEDCLRGWRGSGTIFFSWCNLRCVFCQNHDISHTGEGALVSPERLAGMMLELQTRGCHNINFVTPEHVVPQILEALPMAVEKGLRLPLVYNTSAYDSMESLHLLNGIVDIYMPDFKFWDNTLAWRYLKAKDYADVARQTIHEMQRQVGSLKVNEQGVARRGLLVRHLVMPGYNSDTAQIMRFLASEISPDTYVNIMDQYRPAAKVSPQHYAEINCRPTMKELTDAQRAAREAGLWRIDGLVQHTLPH